jgi:hypothetical protein
VNEPMIDDGLPADAAEQLRRAARTQTEGSVPYPRLAVAIRRDRRRRAAGGVAVGVAAVLAATLVTSAVRADRPTLPSNRGTAPAPTTPEPGPNGDPLSFTGRTAGSLGRDAAWLDGMKQRLVREGKAADAEHARVLWATDHEGRRFAVTVAQNRGVWSVLPWRGTAGSAPAAMTLDVDPRSPKASMAADPEIVTLAYSFRVSDDPPDGDGVLVVVGRGLSEVEISSGLDYTPDGRRSETWRALVPEGPVWTLNARDEELDGLAMRAKRSRGSPIPVAINATPRPTPPAGLADVTPPGAHQGVLSCAATNFDGRRGFPPGSTALLAGTRRFGFDWFGVVVARAPGGGYIVAACRTLNSPYGDSGEVIPDGSYAVPVPVDGPAGVFTLWENGTASTAPGGDTVTVAVVVAPEGATEVEVAGRTAAVRDRLAVVGFPPGVHGAVFPATARNAAGEVLGTAKVNYGIHSPG